MKEMELAQQSWTRGRCDQLTETIAKGKRQDNFYSSPFRYVQQGVLVLCGCCEPQSPVYDDFLVVMCCGGQKMRGDIQMDEKFYNDFKDAMRKVINDDRVELKEVSLHKINGDRKGISIVTVNANEDANGISVGQVIYPDMYYDKIKNGLSLESIVRDVWNIIKEEPGKIRAMNLVKNLGKPEIYLCTGICNYDVNKEWLQDVPHERVADLALYAQWYSNGCSIRVNNDLMKKNGLQKDEVLKIAKENTMKTAIIKSLDNVIFEEDAGLVIVTVADGLYGASAIVNPQIIERIKKVMGGDFYILPSSIHEVLIAARSGIPGEVEALKNIVYDINRREVPLEERLSDNVYEIYKGSLRVANE